MSYVWVKWEEAKIKSRYGYALENEEALKRLAAEYWRRAWHRLTEVFGPDPTGPMSKVRDNPEEGFKIMREEFDKYSAEKGLTDDQKSQLVNFLAAVYNLRAFKGKTCLSSKQLLGN